MEFKSAISTAVDSEEAVARVCGEVSAIKPDLVMMFVSHHHGPEFANVLSGVWDKVNGRNLVGCTGESIIGPDIEVERQPALALWAARMPGVRVLPFVVDQEDLSLLESREDWHERTGVKPEDRPSFVLLPEPFSIDAQHCLNLMDRAFAGSKIVGGIASGASGPGQNRLFLNDQVLRQGLVGVSLSGPVEVETVVSQGCRIIDEPYVVTKAEQNVIFELRGRPALEVLQGVYNRAESADQALMKDGLHIGRVVDERLGSPGQGDFLVSNVMGFADNGAIAISSVVRNGQTVQFHVRDSSSADEEMKSLLRAKVGAMERPPQGGLLFSCNRRGRRMFGAANHDIGVVNSIVGGQCPIAGFFAGGEIGPVGDRTFIHGFTSSLILFQAG